VVPSGPAAWFAAATGATCRAATATERPAGVFTAVACTYPGVVAVFGQAPSPTAAAEILVRNRVRRANSTLTAWGQGDAVVYGGASTPTILWDYTGQPYVGFALSNNRSTLTSWWTSTGRTVRTGG